MTPGARSSIAARRIFAVRSRSALRALAIALTLVAIGPAAPGAAPASEIAEAYAEVRRVAAELELLRTYLGKPPNAQPPLAVRGAGTRDAYYQALTTFQKADKLAFELTATRSRPPSQTPTRHSLEQVAKLSRDTLQRIERIRQSLAIEEVARITPYEGTPDLDALFVAIVQNSRQLNLMLWEPYSPTEVYQRLAEVLHVAQALHRHAGHGELPAKPPHEPKKQPADVYLLLLENFYTTQDLMGAAGEQTRIELDPTSQSAVVPSDVYDIASLLLGEITSLHEAIGATEKPAPSYYPGRKLPSDVHQLARWVRRHLEDLQSLRGLAELGTSVPRESGAR